MTLLLILFFYSNTSFAEPNFTDNFGNSPVDFVLKPTDSKIGTGLFLDGTFNKNGKYLSNTKFSESVLRKKCPRTPELEFTSCNFSNMRPLLSADGQRFFVFTYQTFLGSGPSYKPYGWIQLLVRYFSKDLEFLPIWMSESETGNTQCDDPEIILNSDHKFILLPSRMSGTGNFHNDILLEWSKNEFQWIDTQSLEKDLSSRLPKGLSIDMGIYPNYSNMRISMGAWKKNDSTHFPTGGFFHAELGIEDRKVVVKSFKHFKNNSTQNDH